MIDVKRVNDEIVVRFPKELLSNDELEHFLRRLRLEEVISKSRMTEELAWEISEEIKESWWEKNKDKFLEDIK
jgi:hypothetical protein